MELVQHNDKILCATNSCTMNPLKLQKGFSTSSPMSRPRIVTIAEDIKLIAIQKSLIASPLEGLEGRPKT